MCIIKADENETLTGNETMQVQNIKSAKRFAKRFVGCTTYEEMKAMTTSSETIGVYKYGGGTQVEVRAVRFGRREIRVTAEVA